ncbi:hypothetical protein [Dysgonomonas sp. 511]|uniref:hypothetical protein n=1 Tax=Dysgonomonas sp. 511 TaxID=2302930 RepID=UPI0013D3B810|nr:hypothetical protein [Dysgonomonas sp. 511]
MEKLIKKSIILVIAAAVFFTGAGITIMHYCCSSMSYRAVTVIQQHTCCAHTGNNAANSCCDESQKACAHDSDGAHKHCTSTRLSIDIDAASFRPHIALPFVWVLDVLPVFTQLLNCDLDSHIQHQQKENAPPNIPPREYLSIIRVLII